MHEKGLLVAPKIDKQSCKAMIRVSWNKRFPTYDIEKYIWVKPHQEFLLKPRPKKWAIKSLKK
jgi:hypothetical protein